MNDEELNYLANIRHAIGDNGKRMQSELVEYIRATFESERALRVENDRLKKENDEYARKALAVQNLYFPLEKSGTPIKDEFDDDD